MGSIDIYLVVVGFFQQALENFSTGLMNAIKEFVSIKIMLNAIGMFVIITFAIKKLQEGDFFTWKNAFGIILMVTYLGVFNIALNNPTDFMDFFYSFITYPANELTTKISAQTAGITETSPTGMSNVGYVITKTLSTATEIFNRMCISAGFGVPIFGDGATIKGDVLAMLLAGVIVVFSVIYLIVVLLIVVAAEFQLFIWKCLALVVIVLLLVPQTRGMAGAYVKYLIGLTFYKPFVLIFGYLVFNVLNYLITNLPQKEAYLAMTWTNIAQTCYPLLFGGILGIVVATALLKQVPQFINQVIGATSSIGMGIAAAGQTAMAKTGGAATGVAGGAAIGNAKSAYQNAGGGIGGLVSAAAATATGGGSKVLGKALGAGAKAVGNSNALKDTQLGKALQSFGNTGGSAGKILNDSMNKNTTLNNINDKVSKGVSAGANAAREMGKKFSNKK